MKADSPSFWRWRIDGICTVLFVLGYFGLVPSRAIPYHQSQDELSKEVTAIFAKHCQQCHGESKQKGGLRLDRLEQLLLTSPARPVIVPGAPETSRLLQRIVSSKEEERMPPQGDRLPPEEITRVREWISTRTSASASMQPSPNSQPHWSFQPIKRPVVPLVEGKAWCRNEIDSFIMARLEKEGLTPSPEADRPTLIRRLYLDLIGLPPSPNEVEQFVRDSDASAYEKLVDRLLASPHFGERWARHWLDLARYGDSDGYEHDEPRPHAYHYRDWVIKAFNQDMPFDQFTIEQLAGDLLQHPKPEHLVATGFHRQTLRHNTAEMVAEEYRVKAVKDRVATTGIVWLGMTTGCAECHDHKYDPFSQLDYYRLFAFFNDAQEYEAVVTDSNDQNLTIDAFHFQKRSSHLHPRGVFPSAGPEVEPGTPGFLPKLKSEGKRANRLDLARWLMSPAHPLPARVEANRLWEHLLGKGLVADMDDFGRHGSPPSHPALLDWLAVELQSNGWRRKKLIKQIVTSAVYRQSSQFRKELQKNDPQNTLLARQNRFRVEAEIVHDLALEVSGLLQKRSTGGESFQPPFPKGLDVGVIKNNKLLPLTRDDSRYRRGIYIQVQRTFQHPFLKTFDAPDGNQACARRDRAHTPAQALTLLNDPIVVECAEKLGAMLAQHPGEDHQRLEYGFRLCLGRSPTPREMTVLQDLLSVQERLRPDAPWTGVATVFLNMEAFTTRE